MAKEDFCFTYYDGDAARDKAHMSRLERGAYDDLISAQRKRGHLSLDDIKKVLSKDFDVCWSSMEWILLKDADGKYFIEWVDKSIEKMRRQSEKQKTNVFKRWNKDKNDTMVLPSNNHGNDLVMPLVNGNGDEYVKVDVLKGVQGENLPDEEDDGPMPLGHDMYMLFLKTNPTYPQMPSKDCPAIMDIGLFIHIQNSGSQVSMLHFSKEERAIVLHEWGRWCDWYKAYGGNDDLAYIQKFKQQKIFSELKNGKKYGSNQGFDTNGKNTGGKSAGANLLVTKLEESLRTG